MIHSVSASHERAEAKNRELAFRRRVFAAVDGEVLGIVLGTAVPGTISVPVSAARRRLL